MMNRYCVFVVSTLSTLAVMAVPPAQSQEARDPEKVIIAYLFPEDRLIDPQEIAADKLTHINYAFANIRDGRMVEGFARDGENYQVLVGLRRQHPHLKVLVSVGGWTWSGAFSDMALSSENRRRFIESAVDFVRRHDIDGVDVDWEYPGLIGYGNPFRPEDKVNFTLLMKELRAGLDAETARTGRRYLTSLAAGASPDFLAHTEMAEVATSVDFVNLMTYDFSEAEADPMTMHHACLYTNPRAPKTLSADSAVSDFLAAGVPAGKLVLGVPFYGRAWGDVAVVNDGLFQPGAVLKERIRTDYADLEADLIDKNGFVRRWDGIAQAPYLWNASRRVFISYEDVESIALKSRYVCDRGLRGMMFWEYTADRTGKLLDRMASGLGVVRQPSAPLPSPPSR